MPSFQELLEAAIDKPLEYSRLLSIRLGELEEQSDTIVGGGAFQSAEWSIDGNDHFITTTDSLVDIGTPDGGFTKKRPRRVFVGDTIVAGGSPLFNDPLDFAGHPMMQGAGYFSDSTELLTLVGSADSGPFKGGFIGFQRAGATLNASFWHFPVSGDVPPGTNLEDIYFATNDPTDGFRRRIRFDKNGDITLAFDVPGATGGICKNTKAIEYFDQSSDPAPPTVGRLSVYFKNGDLYKQDDVGNKEKIFITSFGGLSLPQMTTALRDAIVSPPDGLMIHNSDTGIPNVRSLGVWKAFTLV